MIKQIQLRGISRTPSDRMTADGGCAESLNVHLDEQETAPTLPPEDVTDTFYSGTNTGPGLFIHKGLNYENLIFLDKDDGKVKAHKKNSDVVLLLFQPNSGETINNVKSVGNTLVFSTNQRMLYVLYKEETYKLLGEQIPIPAVEFRTKHYLTNARFDPVPVGNRNLSKKLIDSFTPRRTTVGSGRAGTGRHSGGATVTTVAPSVYDGLKGWNTGTWEAYLNGDNDTEAYDESFAEINNTLWDLLKAQMKYVKKHGYFCCPVFARYALKLYDGSYIYQSVPILLGTGDKDFFLAYGFIRRYSGDTTYSSHIAARLTSAYLIKAYLSDYNIDGWEDIVKSIDIFLSTDIHTPLLNAEITGIEEDTESSYTGDDGDAYFKFDLFFDEDEDDEEKQKRLDEVLSKTNFYRIATFGVSDLSKLTSGFNLMSKKKLLAYNADLTSQDILVQQPELPDDYLSHNKKRADDLFQYNNKVIMTGVSQEITSGYQFMNGSVVRADGSINSQHSWQYRFFFYMRDSSNNPLLVFGRTPATSNNEIYESTYNAEIRNGHLESINHDGQPPYQWVITTTTSYSMPFAWLAYPDPRCYKVLVACRHEATPAGYWRTKEYKMEPHPGLNCAYVYIGLGEQLGDVGDTAVLTPEANLPSEEKRLFNENNIIWASGIDNPFLFPAAGRLSFHSEVISVANATRTLSEGQFGQFPLYVFTKDGIWAVPISETSDFLASVPMSRDIVVSKNAIQTVEQAIIFVSDQGVMLLQGSNVTNLSPNMNGRHFMMEENVISVLSNSIWQALSAIENDEDTFMGFVKNSRIAYDYAGERLIFFDDNKLYQYVYYMRTQTWHKIFTPMTDFRVLNSYPECVIGAKTRETTPQYKLMDFSTMLDDADILSDTANPVKGIIVTRPFDLGEPDIRKEIRNIRIRGKFNREDVQYILLGSFDDIHWERLRSLRGGSFKLFRLVLLCNLSPTERISWIDVDYETRFTNRLR